MADWWTTLWRRGMKKAGALRAPLCVETLEERSLLTAGLQVVPSPVINNSVLNATAAIADNDIWAVGDITGSSASANVTLAEHFNGSGWSVVPTPAVQGGGFAGVAGVACNDVWAVGS